MKIARTEEMRQLESDAVAIGMDERTLMELAGYNIATLLRTKGQLTSGKRVLILAGVGNNGGDGLVAAYHLYRFGVEPYVYLTRGRTDDANLKRVQSVGIPVAIHGEGDSAGRLDEWLASADCVLDALLGTGATPPLRGSVLEILRALHENMRAETLCVAVDIPSGIIADSGEADPQAFQAHFTLATGFAKPGCFVGKGADCAGEVSIADIGLPEEWADPLTLQRTSASLVQGFLPKRTAGAHKGTFGRSLIVAGSSRYIGAASLSAAAAARAGAGLVTVALPASIHTAVAARVSECTFLPLSNQAGHVTSDDLGTIMELLPQYRSLLVGCGLGSDPETYAFVRALVHELRNSADAPPLVLDADGINAIVGQRLDSFLPPQTILTPHAGEFGRLLGQSAAEIDGNRLQLAQQCAADWGVVVMAKGAPSISAAPDGTTYINPHRNPALATAGTGDVLAGITVGLLAQGAAPRDSAVAGAFIHGEAGARVRSRLGDSGLLASDLLDEIPLVTKSLRE
ncbi:MAG: NAD(P)H-hydrate dehydratase [Chloroflexi bacterium]|nr:NAD(P)H-hydrate dehydratase [Chloroflexota bacterium]